MSQGAQNRVFSSRYLNLEPLMLGMVPNSVAPRSTTLPHLIWP